MRVVGVEPTRLAAQEPKGDVTLVKEKIQKYVGGECLTSPSGNIPVYEIHSFHSLTQFIGFGKYLNRESGNVYLRGQTSLYNGSLTPSALRGNRNRKTEFQNHLIMRSVLAIINTTLHLVLNVQRVSVTVIRILWSLCYSTTV